MRGDDLELRQASAWEHFERGDLVRAEQELARLIADYPDFADAHADLAEVAGALGDERRRIEQLLIVRRLDAREDREAGLDVGEYEALILESARATLEKLPVAFRQKLARVPVLIEDRPSIELVREGFDPRSLGLFEGLDHEGHTGGDFASAASRVVLYTANLAAFCEDEAALVREVEITVLHEVGHYFGLDEEDMARLGLD